MDISIEGPLSKWTNVVIGWQYRWFVLDEGAGVLWYYTVCIGYIGKGRGCRVLYCGPGSLEFSGTSITDAPLYAQIVPANGQCDV